MTDHFTAGPSGLTYIVPMRGTPTDGASITFPRDSLTKQIDVSIGYVDQKIEVKEGTPSGIVLRLEASPDVEFARAVTIGISFRPKADYKVVVGYAIDEEGRLRPMDLVGVDMKLGQAAFSTFKPVTFTWVYVGR
jgi:hypothetical protein